MKVLKLPTKPNRLLNWSQVSRVDRIEPSKNYPNGGIWVFFNDGAKVYDGRTFEEAEKLVQKYWRRTN